MNRGTADAREPPTAMGSPCVSVAGWGRDLRVKSREGKCEKRACLPFWRRKGCVVASIVLTMGWEEQGNHDRGKVDPRRAQVAQAYPSGSAGGL